MEATPWSILLHERSGWTYATLETLHFFGLTLVIGAIGLFDLRVLGVARAIPPSTLHKLIPWGVVGFALTLVTGGGFVIARPNAYAFNLAFRMKLLLMLIAGLNVLWFYGSTAFREVKEMPAGADAPVRGKVITAVSLTCWLGVLLFSGLMVGGYFG